MRAMPPRSSHRTIQAARERRMILDTAIQATGADRIDALEQDRRNPALWRADVHQPGGRRLHVILDRALGTVVVAPMHAAYRAAA
jgi:hypothetical protein